LGRAGRILEGEEGSRHRPDEAEIAFDDDAVTDGDPWTAALGTTAIPPRVATGPEA
jgi:hypothetical protein